MEKIVIFNANNESMQVDVVRSFSEGENKYLVFSLHEVDDQGHMNIYVTKIMDQNGSLIGTNIIDDVEWTNLKTNLQRIIKENRTNGKAIVNDLPCSHLQNMKVADRRALKLLAASVDMLNLGYNPKSSEEVGGQSSTVSFEQPNVQNQTINPTPISNPQPENQATVQSQPIIQPNDLSVFNNPVQNSAENVQNIPNSVQNSNADNNISSSNVQTAVENSMSENYKDLYFQEKQNVEKLTEENNRLINELNNAKMMISDIKNILSR